MSQPNIKTHIVTNKDMNKMLAYVRETLDNRADMYPPQEWDIRDKAENEALKAVKDYLCEDNNW